MKRIKIVADYVERGIRTLCMVLIGLSAIGIMINVAGRRFGFNVAWMNTITTYAIIWVTFLYAGVLTFNDGHIKISFILDKLPDFVQAIVEYVRLVTILAFGAIFLLLGWFYTIDLGFVRDIHATNIPQFWAYLSLAVGGLLLVFFTVVLLVQGVSQRRARPVVNESDSPDRGA